MEYDNRNSGALFVEETKKTATHPDFNGTLDVNGVEYWISGWKKKSKGGKKFISLSIKPKNEKQQSDNPSDDWD